MSDRSTSTPVPLSLREARAAAASVRTADRGSIAMRTVRPKGVGLARGRGPLWLRLYLASRDGRLVLRDLGSFALLEPPSVRQVRLGRPGHRLLVLVERNWDLFVFGVPPFLLLLLAFLFGLLGVPLLVSLLLVLVAVTYVLVSMVGQVLAGLVAVARLGRRTGGPGRAMAESRPAYQWSVPLLHESEPDRVEGLTRMITDRLAGIVESRLLEQARVEGARIGPVVVHHVLVLLTNGITTAAAHERLIRHTPQDQMPYGPSGEVVLVMSEGRPAARDEDPVIGGGSFALLYLTAVAMAIGVCAVFVASDEASRCVGSSCDGRPVTWGDALHYLAYRLFLSDPTGLSPAGFRGVLFGWLVSALGLMTVPVMFVAARQEIKRFAQESKAWSNRIDDLGRRALVLLLLVTEAERNAVLREFAACTGQRARVTFNRQGTVYELGRISNADVVMVQAGEAGESGPAAMGHTARWAIEGLCPDYAILIGICYGLRPAADAIDAPADSAGDQQMGDVIVARRVQALDHNAVRELDGVVHVVRRSPQVQADHILIDRCLAGQATWTRPIKVHLGLVLSSNTLVDSLQFVRALREEFPDALGGEMEAMAVYAAAQLRKVDWIVIKSICDWGANKNSKHHVLAASNSAGFVTHLLTVGALDDRRRGRPDR